MPWRAGMLPYRILLASLRIRKLPSKRCYSASLLALSPYLELCTVGIERRILRTRAILQSIDDLDCQVNTSRNDQTQLMLIL